MKPVSYGIVLLGTVALVRWGTKDRLKAVYKDPSLWFFVFGVAWMYWITRGTMLSHFDEGSHWYRICKAISYEHAYPTTPEIFYNEYVPGCALWVYFITRFLGFTIPNAMFAQNILNVAAVTVLYCSAPKEKGFWWRAASFVIIALTGVLLCGLTVSTYTLLVDVQLGLFALAALLIVLDQGNTKDAFVPTAMVFGFLALIKISALMFSAIVFIWSCAWQRCSRKDLIKRICGWVAFPLMLYGVYVFRSKWMDLASAQSISVERYASLFSAKSPESIFLFTKWFFYNVLINGLEGSAAVHAAIGLIALLCICLRSEGDISGFTQMKRYGVWILVTMAAYVLALHATYLFSMNAQEAATLNSLYRYYGTGAILAIGTTVYAVLKFANRPHPRRMYFLSALLLFVLLAPGAFSKRYILNVDEYRLKEDFRSDIWRATAIYIPENKYYSDASYAVLWNQDDFYGGSRDNGRVSGIVGAWLRADHLEMVSEWELRDGIDEKKLEALRDCDYLVCISDMSRHSEVFSQIWENTELTVGLRELPHDADDQQGPAME